MVVLFDQEDDYVNEDHIHAFAKALLWDDADDTDAASAYSSASGQNSRRGTYIPRGNTEGQTQNGLGDSAPPLLPVGSPDSRTKPSLITSKSDWFPVSRRRPRPEPVSRLTNEFRVLALYAFFRWPVLVLITLWVVLLTILYAAVRMYVAFLEYIFTWTGQRKVLRDKLRKSRTYDEWVERAIALDEFLGLDKWLESPRFSYYDHASVHRTTKRLRALREAGDAAGLMVLLQACLKPNFAGIENRQLYLHRYYGTKTLVEQYVQEVETSVDAVASLNVPGRQKRRFFRSVARSYGKSALCLSGGACFAYTHFGIVKALLDNDLLPLIISGTSGGGLVAALACTRTDDELRQLLVPELARKITACEDPWYVWIPRWWRTGARFDAVAWARKACYFTKGSTTFLEAYRVTGRKLNILTVPAEPHLPVILCNTVTSPHCIVWLSLLASSAVPGILNPVVLMMKEPQSGRVVPFSMGNKWRDGSLRTDIPVDALNTYYNVTFLVVSQVNPHILLFFFAPKGTVGRPVASARRKTRRARFASLRGGFLATAAELLLRLEIKKWLQIVKTLDLLPRWLEQDWLNVFLQRFTGSITIWPRNRLADFWNILLDPSQSQMAEYLAKGERSMFPRLLFVKHRLTIERAIERGRKATKHTADAETDATSRSPSAGVGSDDVTMPIGIEAYGSESSDDETKRRFIVSPFDRVYNDAATDTTDDEFDDEEEDDEDDQVDPLSGNGGDTNTEATSVDHELDDTQQVKFRRNTTMF